MNDSILFQLFQQLRQQKFSLGAADYLLVLEAMRSGLGLEDLEQFKRLLKLLWAKSPEEQKLLALEFDRWLKPHLSPTAKYSEEKLEQIEEFKLFCRLRWAKSPQEGDLFEQAFSELVKPQLQAIAAPTPPPPSLPPPTASPPPPSPPPKDLRLNAIPIIWLLLREINSLAGILFLHKLFKPPKLHQPDTPRPPINGQKKQLSLEQKQVELHFGSVQPPTLPDKPELVEESHHFQLIPRLPMSQREMAEIWRQLRRPQRVGKPEELDVEGTIDSICRTGFLLRPVWRSRRCNQAQLVVLVDRLGSMAPFSLLVEGIRESIVRGGLRGRASFYYFHDCPDTYLYKRPQLTGAISLKTVLFEQMQGNSVLIISDAGAACGFYDEERREATKTFVKEIQSYTYLYAWLNPLPEYRWTATTAEDIEQFIPMFPFNRDGLHDMVNILRGYPFPPGVRLDG
jgi:uncharacterized protein with von Willebrand factor type A (vWA) domain